MGDDQMLSPYILDEISALDFRNANKMLTMVTKCALPLLHLLNVINRYIIICHPHLIAQYCSRAKAVTVIVCILTAAFSAFIHEMYDNNYLSVTAFNATVYAKRSRLHESYSGLINITVLSCETLAVLLGFSVLTKKVNGTLATSIEFLERQNGDRFGKNVASYKRLMHSNLTLYFICTLTMVGALCQTVFLELHNIYAIPNKNLTSPLAGIFVAGVELFLSLEIVLYPVFLALYGPIFQSILMRFEAFGGCRLT